LTDINTQSAGGVLRAELGRSAKKKAMTGAMHVPLAEILNRAPLAKAQAASRSGRLLYLDVSSDCILSVNTDGSDRQIIASGAHMPDGVAVDVEGARIYWTNMGVPDLDDGSIESADLDGGNRRTIVPPGVTHTPKQLHLDKAGGKLYWCDREGMRVMRASLDGSSVETLIKTGRGEAHSRDQTRWCVGVTVDHGRGEIYWSQKGPPNAGQGRIFRAGLEIPRGESPERRSDIELVFDELPEPIDLELDEENRVLYWTDRGDPPRGNTVNRAPTDGKAKPQILVTHLMEGIGLTLDLPRGRMFFTDLGGSIYAADLDGRNRRQVAYAQGNLTGVAYADL